MFGAWQTSESEVVKREFCQMGGIPILIKCGNVPNEGLQDAVLSCLWSFSETTEDRIDLIAGGGLQLAIDALTTSPKHQLAATGILRNLAGLDDAKDVALKAGCGQATITLLR